MKTKTLSLIGIMLLCFGWNAISQQIVSNEESSQKSEVNISCTPDLFPLASDWVGAYRKLHPEVDIKVIDIPYNSLELGNGKSLSFISNNSSTTISNKSNWKIAVGRNVVVPIMNITNPLANEILRRGISPEMFVQILGNPENQNWGFLAADQNVPLHIFIVNDESVKTSVSNFLLGTQFPSNSIIFGTKDEVIAAIRKDVFAIGFCKIADVLGSDNMSLAENISLLPIDKNGNGSIDYMEGIYSDANTFMRGVWIGKYPKSLYSNIYAVSNMQPTNNAELAFLTWILTDGQQFMNINGYCDLGSNEAQSQIDKLTLAGITVTQTKDASQAGLWLLILVGIVALTLVIRYVVRRYQGQKNVVPDFNFATTSFDEDSVLIPNGLYYDKSHTWAFMEKNGSVTVGLDDFLQHITGSITRVELKKAGEKIKKGDLLFSIIQSGKRLNLYAPVSGVIKTQNEELFTDSDLLNTSPYSKGWVYLIEPTNWIREIQFLDMAEKYKMWINTEFSRVKDFLASTLKPESLEYSHVVLQDGGLLKDGILADFGPEVWEDFQVNFLDSYN